MKESRVIGLINLLALVGTSALSVHFYDGWVILPLIACTALGMSMGWGNRVPSGHATDSTT